MPRTRMTNVSAAQWSPNGGAMGQSDLTQAGAYAFGANVFSPEIQRQRLPRAAPSPPLWPAARRAPAWFLWASVLLGSVEKIEA